MAVTLDCIKPDWTGWKGAPMAVADAADIMAGPPPPAADVSDRGDILLTLAPPAEVALEALLEGPPPPGFLSPELDDDPRDILLPRR